MYVNGVYVPLSEDNIGVVANVIDVENIKVEIPEIKKTSFFDFIECYLYYKDKLGNSYTDFDLK